MALAIGPVVVPSSRGTIAPVPLSGRDGADAAALSGSSPPSPGSPFSPGSATPDVLSPDSLRSLSPENDAAAGHNRPLDLAGSDATVGAAHSAAVDAYAATQSTVGADSDYYAAAQAAVSEHLRGLQRSESATPAELAKSATSAAAALRDPRTGALVGVLVASAAAAADLQLLRIARDVVHAALGQPEIFVVLDAAIARLPADALLESLTEAERAEMEAVASLVERVRRTSAIDDRWDVGGGRRMLDAKLARFVRSRLPVRLVLPAFPMKSPDAVGKVLGDQPDAGELLALLTLDALARDVAAVYAPGCHVLVVSDGRVFNDIYVVPDDDVSRYGRMLRQLAPAGHLQFIGLDELFASMGSADKRAAVVAFGARGTDDVAAKLAVDAHFREIYLAFKKLLMRDCGLNQYRASAAAKIMMRRNECYSDLIRLLFPHHIRLSIHDHSGLEKIGIHLVGRSIITPWHGVAVRHRDGRWSIVRRRDAERAGFVARDLRRQHATDTEADGQATTAAGPTEDEMTRCMRRLAHVAELASAPYYDEV